MPTILHSSFTGLDLHEDKRIKLPVRAASTGALTLTAPGATIDGVTLAVNDRVLLKDQAAPAENGIYVWTGAAVTLTRATDANAANILHIGFLVYVREGTINAGSMWAFSQTSAVTLGTTALTFVRAGGGGGLWASVAVLMEDQASGVAGGTFTSGAWQNRVFNDNDSFNTGNFVFLDFGTTEHQFVVEAGTYDVFAWAVGYGVDKHQIRWIPVGGGTTIPGTPAFSSSTTPVPSVSLLRGQFNILVQTRFRVQHQCQTTRATDGLGSPAGFGELETYALAELRKRA